MAPIRTLTIALCASVAVAAPTTVPTYGIFEAEFESSGSRGNPYRETTADAAIARPGGTSWSVPLFWDGGASGSFG
ncbi:MAG TPA: DUF5060 domain-containing protein [Bryobacteraceae bacterium]|nr:DUF5060 domain-containing protein [Bryobacteraceae bacterium]